MNYREDLEIKLQKVTLAMQEVVDDIHKTELRSKEKFPNLLNLKKQLFQRELNLILN